MTMQTLTRDDIDAAMALLGYHPSHVIEWGSMFCGKCATNVTGEHGPLPCPYGVSERALRTWDFLGSTRMWTVEERIDHKNGGTYLYCQCPAWKFGGQVCKHTAQVKR